MLSQPVHSLRHQNDPLVKLRLAWHLSFAEIEAIISGQHSSLAAIIAREATHCVNCRNVNS